jgi:acid stress-induced BolA-like protein IbaG/YrbA
MLLPSQIEEVIVANLECDFIKVKGDDGTHFEATIVSPLFKDQSMIKQHQMVYLALGDMMKQEIHALSIKTITPEQWQEFNKLSES